MIPRSGLESEVVSLITAAPPCAGPKQPTCSDDDDIVGAGWKGFGGVGPIVGLALAQGALGQEGTSEHGGGRARSVKLGLAVLPIRCGELELDHGGDMRVSPGK